MTDPIHAALQKAEHQIHAQHGQIAALTLLVSTYLAPQKMPPAEQQRRVKQLTTTATTLKATYSPESQRAAFADGMEAVFASVLAGWQQPRQK